MRIGLEEGREESNGVGLERFVDEDAQDFKNTLVKVGKFRNKMLSSPCVVVNAILRSAK
jgi:hypothetical protein